MAAFKEFICPSTIISRFISSAFNVSSFLFVCFVILKDSDTEKSDGELVVDDTNDVSLTRFLV